MKTKVRIIVVGLWPTTMIITKWTCVLIFIQGTLSGALRPLLLPLPDRSKTRGCGGLCLLPLLPLQGLEFWFLHLLCISYFCRKNSYFCRNNYYFCRNNKSKSKSKSKCNSQNKNYYFCLKILTFVLRIIIFFVITKAKTRTKAQAQAKVVRLLLPYYISLRAEWI